MGSFSIWKALILLLQILNALGQFFSIVNAQLLNKYSSNLGHTAPGLRSQ